MRLSAVRLSILVASTVALGACAYDRPEAQSRAIAWRAPQADPELRDAQAQLRTLGLYGGPVDGLWGPETAAAVERYQRDHRLTVTARLDNDTLAALRDGTSPAPLQVTDTSNVRAIQHRLGQLGFYDGPVDGVWGRDTQISLERFQRARNLPQGQVTVATLSAMGLDPNDYDRRTLAADTPAMQRTATPLEPPVVRGVQQRLRVMGFYRGPADGVWGPETHSALIEFQKSRGLDATGDLTPATASVLGLNPNNLRRSVTTYGGR
jgi:peptidoglycan hydrolase-like protein with peptidoglycan-binding domain